MVKVLVYVAPRQELGVYSFSRVPSIDEALQVVDEGDAAAPVYLVEDVLHYATESGSPVVAEIVVSKRA